MKVYAVKSLVFDGYTIKGLFTSEIGAVKLLECLATYIAVKVDNWHYTDRFGSPLFEIEEMEVLDGEEGQED